MAESNQHQPKRRGPGKPFAKGQSGNPGGRPKEVAEVRELARDHTETAVNTLVSIMTNGEQPAAARVRASEVILDRGYGRAPQSFTAAITRLKKEERDAVVAALGLAFTGEGDEGQD